MISRHNYSFRYLIYLVIMGICSCTLAKIDTRYETAVQTGDNYNSNKWVDFSSLKRSKVLETGKSTWKTVNIPIGRKKEVISAISFIDDDVGWACNKTHIYKTIDSGKTWTVYNIDFAGKGEIVFLQFTDELKGWMIVEELGQGAYSEDDQVNIYSTSDGGANWKLARREKSVQFNDALFSKETGWVIGMRYIGDGARMRSPMVLTFSNDSNSWTDVSERVKQISYDQTYPEGDFPALDHLSSKGGNCVIAVNKPGKIVESCNQGVSWQSLYNLDNFPSISSYGSQQIGFNDDIIWIIECGQGDPILTILPMDTNEPKKRIRMPIYIRQGFAISKREFFVVAETNDRLGKQVTNNGMILHSTDMGDSWDKLFSIPSGIRRAQFFPVQKDIWLLTDDGVVIKAFS